MDTENVCGHADHNHESVEDTPEKNQEAESENINTPTLNIEAADTPRRFLGWLKKGLIEKTLLINDVNAEVHIVAEGVFLLAPAIFKSFLNKHGLPGEAQHKNLSRRFARLRVHVKAGDVLVELDPTMNQADLGHQLSDLMSVRIDIARLTAALESQSDPEPRFVAPEGASPDQAKMGEQFLKGQVAQYRSKLAALVSEEAQKRITAFPFGF